MYDDGRSWTGESKCLDAQCDSPRGRAGVGLSRRVSPRLSADNFRASKKRSTPTHAQHLRTSPSILPT